MRLFLALSLCAALCACVDRVRGEASSTVVVEEPGEFYYWEYYPDGHRVRRHGHRGDEDRRAEPSSNPPPGPARVTVAPPDPSPTPTPAPLVRVKAGLP